MEKSKKLMWRSRPQLRTFILFPAAKGGGGEKSKRGRKGEDLAWGGDKKEDSSKTRLSVPLEFTCNGVNLNNILASSHLNYT